MKSKIKIVKIIYLLYIYIYSFHKSVTCGQTLEQTNGHMSKVIHRGAPFLKDVTRSWGGGVTCAVDWTLAPRFPILFICTEVTDYLKKSLMR